MSEEPNPESTLRYRKVIVLLVRLALAFSLGITLVVFVGYLVDKPFITSFGDGIGMAKPTVIVNILLSLAGFGLLTLSTRD